MNYELIREQLEEKYTHVTFVKSYNRGKSTVWTVNEAMEKIYIHSDTEVLANVEYIKLVNEASSINRMRHEKLSLFYMLMVAGKLPYDYKLYKKYTLKQLEGMI